MLARNNAPHPRTEKIATKLATVRTTLPVTTPVERVTVKQVSQDHCKYIFMGEAKTLDRFLVIPSARSSVRFI